MCAHGMNVYGPQEEEWKSAYWRRKTCRAAGNATPASLASSATCSNASPLLVSPPAAVSWFLSRARALCVLFAAHIITYQICCSHYHISDLLPASSDNADSGSSSYPPTHARSRANPQQSRQAFATSWRVTPLASLQPRSPISLPTCHLGLAHSQEAEECGDWAGVLLLQVRLHSASAAKAFVRVRLWVCVCACVWRREWVWVLVRMLASLRGFEWGL